MKISKLSFLVLSLPMATVGFPYSCANAALRIDNSSAMQSRAQMNMANQPQPARVVTDNNGTQTVIDDAHMNACNSIYHDGKFDWAVPTAGYKAGGPATCVAVVDLVSAKGSTMGGYPVLARAYVAAGDNIKCNVDYFTDLTSTGMNFEYPADNAPTVEEVQSVMAQENRQHLGFKILGAALVGGIGGNLLADGGSDGDKLVGFSGDKLKGTLIGAAGSAAVMTASSTAKNYKTGSMILSTSVNSVAGAMAGNLNASGDDVLNIRDCPFESTSGDKVHKCLYGTLSVSDSSTIGVSSSDNTIYLYDVNDGSAKSCEKVAEKNDEYTKCRSVSLKEIKFDCSDDYCQDISDTKKSAEKVAKNPSVAKYSYEKEGNSIKKETNNDCNNKTPCFIKIKEAKLSGKTAAAVIELPDTFQDKVFGYKMSDWRKTLKGELGQSQILALNGKKLCKTGETKDGCDNMASIEDFTPARVSVDDSETIDFANKSRAKSTLVGAGAGAGLGALAGAAGAESEINERWVASMREYEDSLRNVVCMTGNRPLAYYNDIAIIPEMPATE